MNRSLQERLAALQQSVSGHKTEALASLPLDGVSTHSATTLEPGAARTELLDLGFEQRDDGSGPYWRRTLRYDVLTYHGHMRFLDVTQCALAGLARVAKVNAFDWADLRFYDTETTGLGTGAGTIPFLHAVGYIDEDEFVIHQYFLSDYSEEGALIQSMLREHFAGGRSVVSFNGKSFDWPLLKSRLAMYRLDVPDCSQIDLLYPSRRLWKGRLPRVSLAEVESTILGLTRVDDLPGKDAPNRYFSYVDSQDAGLVDAVFEHNAMDVCSLVTLFALLSDVLEGKRTVASAGELVALGRLYDEWHAFDLADRCFAAAIAAPDVDWKARWLRSMHLKRRGLWEEACHLWQETTVLHAWTVSPAVELAKYYEHRTRDYEAALVWAKTGLQRAVEGERHRNPHITRLSAEPEDRPVSDLVLALRHRVTRIEAKQTAHNRDCMTCAIDLGCLPLR